MLDIENVFAHVMYIDSAYMNLFIKFTYYM